MSFDLTLILTVASLVTGAVWLIDARVFAPVRRRRREQTDEDVLEPVWVDYSRSLFPFVFGLLVLRAFVAEPFLIPSASMQPNLREGDLILVTKFDYGLRLPVIDAKIVPTGRPQRGDVMVFRYPGTSATDPARGTDFIKRVVGVPGDVVAVQGNRITLNGQAVGYTRLAPDETRAEQSLLEQLPGHPHAILELPLQRRGAPRRWTVAEGEYFVMGDNRDHSLDSRVWGFVPESHLVGRASLLLLNCHGFLCGKSFDASRIGAAIP
jgi:signal peptidase I